MPRPAPPRRGMIGPGRDRSIAAALPPMIAAVAVTLCGALALAQPKEAAPREPAGVAKQESAEGFVPLFDGHSLAGWTGPGGGEIDSFEVMDGLLAARPGAGRAIYTRGVYDDFVLRFDFRLTPGANNGVALRAPGEGDPAYVGMESQVLDNAAKKYAGIRPWQRHGSIYGVAAAKPLGLKPAGEWNRQEILCRGARVAVTLNGQRIVDVDLRAAAPGGRTIDGREHPGLFRDSGHLGLLAHGDRVWFRNIRVKRLRE